MLQILILVIISFIAGILAGAGGYYNYANYLYMKHPEFFRYRLEYKIGKKHACMHILEEGQPPCGNPAANHCVKCQLWFCDLHFNAYWQRCFSDNEQKAK